MTAVLGTHCATYSGASCCSQHDLGLSGAIGSNNGALGPVNDSLRPFLADFDSHLAPCPNCVKNVHAVNCAFRCSPQQNGFIQVAKGGTWQSITLRLCPAACDAVYKSCKTVAKTDAKQYGDEFPDASGFCTTYLNGLLSTGQMNVNVEVGPSSDGQLCLELPSLVGSCGAPAVAGPIAVAAAAHVEGEGGEVAKRSGKQTERVEQAGTPGVLNLLQLGDDPTQGDKYVLDDQGIPQEKPVHVFVASAVCLLIFLVVALVSVCVLRCVDRCMNKHITSSMEQYKAQS